MSWRTWTKSLLDWCKRGLHWCKTGLHWCKRLLGDPFCNWPKHLLHPLLTTLGNFEVSASVAGTSGCNPRAKFWRKFSPTWAKDAAKIWRNFSLIFVLQFPGKWAQEISRKALDEFHEPRNNLLSPRDSGSRGAQH